MTVFVVDLVQRQRVFLLQEATAAALKQAKLTAAAAASWVLADDLVGIEEVLQTTRQDSPLRYALIADPGGMVLAHTDHRLVGKHLADDLSLGALKINPGEAKVWHSGGQTIHVSAPILAGQRVIGAVLLGLDTSPTYAHLNYVSRSGFLYMLIAIAAGTLFAWLLARYILRQLNMLLAGVDRLRNNQLDQPIPIINRDEIGRVGQALNRAMEALRQSREETKRQLAERLKAANRISAISPKSSSAAAKKSASASGTICTTSWGQMITSFQFALQSMAEMLDQDPKQAGQLCAQLAGQAEEMGEAIHRTASFLWPATLEHLGLSVTIRSYLDEVNQLLPQLRIEFSSNLDRPPKLPGGVGLFPHNPGGRHQYHPPQQGEESIFDLHRP